MDVRRGVLERSEMDRLQLDRVLPCLADHGAGALGMELDADVGGLHQRVHQEADQLQGARLLVQAHQP